MIYLDNAATTLITKEALDTYYNESLINFGNSSSNHQLGRNSAKELEKARTHILKQLKLDKTHNLIFTSGATEANNLALKGGAFNYKNRGNKIITSNVEHPSVSNTLKQLHNEFGFNVQEVEVNRDGYIDPLNLSKCLDKDTIIVSIMTVNNELGSINNLKEIKEVMKAYPKAYLHTDATQAVGKVKAKYEYADMISFSAHKFGGPKGIGCLVYRKNISFLPVNSGGSHEFGIRAGTVDVPSIKATDVALTSSINSISEHLNKYKEFNHMIEAYLEDNPEQFELNSSKCFPKRQYVGIINFSFKKKKASVVVEALSRRGIYVSSVSACSSKGEPISSVLLAIGKDEGLARNSLRVSFGENTTIDDVQQFINALDEVIKEVNDR